MTSLFQLKSTLMRGGTSKGLFFASHQLPDDPALLERLFIRALGSPDPYGKQIDGVGTGISTTSKVAIVGPSARPDCDIDYLFGHVAIGEAKVDWSGSCGNLTAAVPLFALMERLLPVKNGMAEVRIWQANIGKKIVATLEVRDGEPLWVGDYCIDGVAFPGAPVTLRFIDPAGGASGKLLPTGKVCDALALPNGSRIAATLIDAGNPTVFVRAADLGLTGFETAEQLSADTLARLEALRAAGALAMGLVDSLEAAVARPATPKISFVGEARDEGCALNGRILSMGKLHHAYTGTGAIALAAAAAIKGTVVAEAIGQPWRGKPLTFSHASGRQTLEALVSRQGRSWHIDEVVMTRTARPLMRGEVFVPLD